MISKKVLILSVIVFIVNQSASSPVASHEEVNVDIACISNVTCLKGVSNKVVRALKLKKALDFGIFTVEPLKNAKTEGRSFTKFWDIASSNAINVPLGNYALNIQKSDEYNNYFEVAVSKAVEGRGRQRKQMQFFVPSFLVASQVGWWLLALAGVALLSIKAFLVSKLALVFAGAMTLKKLFEHHHGFQNRVEWSRIPPHYYEHHEPLMIPFNFGGGFDALSAPAFGGNDFHSSLPFGHEQTAALHAGAETALNNVVSNATGASTTVVSAPGLSAFATVARHPPLNVFGKNPYLYRRP